MVEKVAIDLDEPLLPGEIVELHFKSVGGTWIKATQLFAIQFWLDTFEKRFRIKNWMIPTNDKVVFTIVVQKTNPEPVTIAIIAAAILVAGVGIWLTLDGAYKVIQAPSEPIKALTDFIKEPAGTIVAIAIGAMIAGAAVKWFKVK